MHSERWLAWCLILPLALIPACTEEALDPLALHHEAFVVDLHSDTPLRMADGFDFAQRDTTGHMDIPRLKEGGVDLQVLACFVATDYPTDECRARVDELIDSIEVQIAHNSGDITICRTADEALRVGKAGRIAAFIGIENGVALEDDLDNLQHFYDRGVRYLGLTHTASSNWCISSADTAPAFDGLTDFGYKVVRKMNELGMIIDISHAHPSAVEAVLNTTTDPVIASHSCVHAICPHDRNLTDEQIRAIAANGGVIGINFFVGYLAEGNRWMLAADSVWTAYAVEIDSIRSAYPDNREKRREAYRPIKQAVRQATAQVVVDVGTVVDHIDHIVKLVGPDHVGLGSDFDGVGNLPNGLEDCSLVPAITRELVRRGYSEAETKKILGGNFMRVFRRVCGG